MSKAKLSHSLWYTEPSGNTLPNPTQEQVLGWMRQDDYWGPYSPVGVLCWQEHQQRKVLPKNGFGTLAMREQLLFVRHPKRGWYFEYSTSNLSEKRWLVAFDPAADPDSFVTAWAYGEQLHLLGGCFVELTVAERIVTEFMDTREPSPVVRWVPFNDVVPRLDSDEYRERRRQAREKANRKGKKA